MINQFKQQVRDAVAAGLCVPEPIGCGKIAVTFKDELSAREYRITGMCQVCQDKFYAMAEEWEAQAEAEYVDLTGYLPDDEPPF